MGQGGAVPHKVTPLPLPHHLHRRPVGRKRKRRPKTVNPGGREKKSAAGSMQNAYDIRTLRANPDMLALEITFEDFTHLARLYVVGALELDELSHFEEGMRLFGDAAEEY